MKPCSSNYARTSKPQKVAANSASGSQLSTPSHTLATGKDGVHAIVAYARIFSICAAAPSSTICMSWLVPSNFLLSFRTLLIVQQEQVQTLRRELESLKSQSAEADC